MACGVAAQNRRAERKDENREGGRDDGGDEEELAYWRRGRTAVVAGEGSGWRLNSSNKEA